MKKILFIVILIIVFLFFVESVFFKSAVFRVVFLPVTRIIVQIGCKGPSKMFTTLGLSRSPFCAEVYNDGGKSCDSGNECLSGTCYLGSDKQNELAEFIDEKQLGLEELYFGNLDISLDIPPKSGICKRNSIEDCFSEGSAKMENNKVVRVFPHCD